MTKESLERLLVDYGVSFTSALADRLLQEFNPGICEDAISREEAIEIIAATDITNGEEPVFTGKQVIALLKDLDGVIPSRPTGHWIFEKGDGKTCVDGYVCSACNKSFHTHVPYFAEYKYCPNCGAKMKSEEQA